MSLNKIETKHDVFIKIDTYTDFHELKDVINKINKEETDEQVIKDFKEYVNSFKEELNEGAKEIPLTFFKGWLKF
jgi:hypothetical protein